MVRKKRKGLYTSTCVFVAITKSMAGVIPQKRDIPKKHHGARRQDNQSVAGIQERNSQLPVVTVRKEVNAGWADDWSDLMKSEEVNPWVMTKLRESYYQAGQEDDQRNCIVQKVMGREGHTVVRVPSLLPIPA